MTTEPTATAGLLPPDQVTNQQLALYADLIYRQTGIRISAQKKALLSNRLRRRLRKTEIGSFEAYYQHLSGLPLDDPEWDAFLQEITTHETYLFRDESQWNWVRNVYLPDCVAAAAAGAMPRTLRIWSAACSSGDEPYTIASCLAAGLSDLDRWKIQILGTDIGVGVLEQARAGRFGERAMRLVPPPCRRFFQQAADKESWSALPVLSRMITFRQHNLLKSISGGPFDLVFLKNVLIYFDTQSKARVMEIVRGAVRPGGLLVTGAAEGVTDWLKGFRRLQPWLHQKPQQEGNGR